MRESKNASGCSTNFQPERDNFIKYCFHFIFFSSVDDDDARQTSGINDLFLSVYGLVSVRTKRSKL